MLSWTSWTSWTNKYKIYSNLPTLPRIQASCAHIRQPPHCLPQSPHGAGARGRVGVRRSVCRPFDLKPTPARIPLLTSVVGTWSACTLANSMAGCTVGGVRDLSQKLSCLVSTAAHAWTHALISVPLALKLGRTMGVRPRPRKFMQGLGEEVIGRQGQCLGFSPVHKSSPI